MKTNTYTVKIICAVLITAAVAFNFASCKKDSSKSSTTTTTTGTSTSTVALSTNVTEADAAQFASDAVTPANGGLADQLSSTAGIYAVAKLGCGVQKDTTFIKASASGVSPSYSFNFGWNYTLNCNGNVPNQVTFNFLGNGSFSDTLMSATHKSNGQLLLTNFSADSANYAITVAYTRVGTAISKIANKYTFTSTMNIQSTSAIKVSKTTKEIVSGAANVTVVTTASNGKQFTYGGVLTFLGNKKAVLGFTSGKAYNISWL